MTKAAAVSTAAEAELAMREASARLAKQPRQPVPRPPPQPTNSYLKTFLEARRNT